jgi:hypothetical protein
VSLNLLPVRLSWRRSGRLPAAALLALIGGLASGCIASYQTVPWVNTQRYPGPMEQRANLPPGSQDDYPEGPEVVLIVRHADPVEVRQAGMPQGTPMAFYDKRARVHSGSWVHSGSGGRAEVIWPHGTSILLLGYGTGIVGSTSRGEPTFVFREMATARLEPSREEHIELLGGAKLVASQGPIVLARVRDDIVELRNQSSDDVTVEFRDEILLIEPGEVVDLALLSSGARPVARSRSFESVRGQGFELEVSGESEPRVEGQTLVFDASGPTEIEGLGVRVRVRANERVTFQGVAGPIVSKNASPIMVPTEAPEQDPKAIENETSQP